MLQANWRCLWIELNVLLSFALEGFRIKETFIIQSIIEEKKLLAFLGKKKLFCFNSDKAAELIIKNNSKNIFCIN